MAGRCGCARACSCCQSTSASVAVAGSGSAGTCYSSSVRYSTDAGNRARAGTDGAVFADTCLFGPDGEPLEPSPEGCITLPAACILKVGGDPIVPDESGCLQLPANTPPAFGCGLDTNEDDELVVATSGAWPGDDLNGNAYGGAYTEGSEVYCGPDGQLRGAPQGTAVTVGLASLVFGPALTPFDSETNTSASASATLTNPSLARRMLVVRTLTATVDIVIPPDGGAEVRLQERIDGGAWGTVRSFLPPEPDGGTVNIRSVLPITWQRPADIGPGASHQVELRVQVDKTGSGGDDPILVEVNVAARLVGVSS